MGSTSCPFTSLTALTFFFFLTDSGTTFTVPVSGSQASFTITLPTASKLFRVGVRASAGANIEIQGFTAGSTTPITLGTVCFLPLYPPSSPMSPSLPVPFLPSLHLPFTLSTVRLVADYIKDRIEKRTGKWARRERKKHGRNLFIYFFTYYLIDYWCGLSFTSTVLTFLFLFLPLVHIRLVLLPKCFGELHVCHRHRQARFHRSIRSH